MIFAVLAIDSAPVPVSVRAPKIARAAGITAGLTTVPQFEKRFGEGMPLMGGHSGGARMWYDIRHGVLIHADGFNISRDGEILDGFRVEWEPPSAVEKTVPHIRLRRSDLGVLSLLRRGMSRRAAEASLGLRPVNDVVRQKGLIRYSPKPVNKSNDRYTDWTLQLHFGAKGMEAFTIGCD